MKLEWMYTEGHRQSSFGFFGRYSRLRNGQSRRHGTLIVGNERPQIVSTELGADDYFRAFSTL